MSRFKPLIAFMLLLTLGITLVWLVQGSSNQPSHGAWVQGWRELTPFELPRRAPAAVAHRGHLYLVGGIDGDGRYVRPVEYAPLLADGRLGPWRRTTALQQGRFYNAVVAHNGFLYALGGGSGAPGAQNYPIASVERARILDDGSLGSWQTLPDLNTPRRGLKAIVHGDTLYAVGGYDGRFLKSTEWARLLPDGGLDTWQTAAQESIIDRYIHAAAAGGDRLYLLGGHMRDPGTPSYGAVESSRLHADGPLSPWRIETHRLLTPRLLAEAFVLGRHLYIAGGHSGGRRLTSVEVAPLGNDGTVGPWRQTTALPLARSAFAVATYNHRVYLLGGGGTQRPLNSVVMARANARGDLGHAD